MLLEMPTNTFGEAIIKTSKFRNLFIYYQNKTYFKVPVLESSWKWGQDSLKKLTLIIVSNKKSRFSENYFIKNGR
jgi:hypothetical protein